MLPTALLAIFTPAEVVLFSEAEKGVYQKESKKKERKGGRLYIKTLSKDHINIVW